MQRTRGQRARRAELDLGRVGSLGLSKRKGARPINQPARADGSPDYSLLASPRDDLSFHRNFFIRMELVDSADVTERWCERRVEWLLQTRGRSGA